MTTAGAATLIENFDAYGQVLPDNDRGTVKESASRSVRLARAGQTIFWLLVVVIVLARVFYFPASPSFETRNVQETKSATVR